MGRTGSFCASYTALREIDAGCGIPNILDIVEKQRIKRKYMIQEKNQLKIVHDLVHLYAVDLLEQRGVTLADNKTTAQTLGSQVLPNVDKHSPAWTNLIVCFHSIQTSITSYLLINFNSYLLHYW